MRLAYVIPVLLALTACRTVIDPTPMPAGYSYHQNLYKSPPGPPAPEIGYDFTLERNDVIMEKWQIAAKTMIDHLQERFALSPQAVYIDRLPDENAFNNSLDYALREELRSRGYLLASAPVGHTLRLRPEIWMPGDEKIPVEVNRYNGDPEIITTPPHREKTRGFTYRITASRGTVLLGDVQGSLQMPAYGYVRGEGQDRIHPRAEPPVPVEAAPLAKKTMIIPAQPQPLLPAAPVAVEKEVIEEKL